MKKTSTSILHVLLVSAVSAGFALAANGTGELVSLEERAAYGWRGIRVYASDAAGEDRALEVLNQIAVPREGGRVLFIPNVEIDSLAAAENSYCVFGRVDRFADLLPREPRFAKAAAFLSRTDLATLPAGRYEIDGYDVFALVQECKLRDKASNPQPEAHRAYIDIQVPLSGEETYGYGWLTEKNYTKPFDRKKDIGFYGEQPLRWRTLKPGEFSVFLPPYGAHAPCCRGGGPGYRGIRDLP